MARPEVRSAGTRLPLGQLEKYGIFRTRKVEDFLVLTFGVSAYRCNDTFSGRLCHQLKRQWRNGPGLGSVAAALSI